MHGLFCTIQRITKRLLYDDGSYANYRHYLIILSLVLLGYFQLAFLIHPFKFDMLNCHFPWRFFISECIRSGELPFWNPYQFLGSPLHADPQSGAFYYPLYLLALLRRYDFVSLAFEFVAHLCIAGIGMYKVGKRLQLHTYSCLLMAIAYSLSGFMVAHTAHLSWIMSAAWTPWVLIYFFDMSKKPEFISGVKLSLVLLLFFTGGYPAFNIIVLYILLASFVFVLVSRIRGKDIVFVKKYLLYTFISGILFLILLSPYILSVYQMLPYLDRSSGLSYADAVALPFHPIAMISLLFPFSMVSYDYYELTRVIPTDISLANAYMGLGIIVFMFYSLRRKVNNSETIVLSVLFVFFLLISFGDVLPLRGWLFEYLPFMNLFRFSGLFRLFAIICAIILAGIGMNRYVSEHNHYTNRLQAIVLIVAATVLIFVVYALSRSNIIETLKSSANFRELFLNQMFYNRIVIQGFIQLVLLGVILFFIRQQNSRLRLKIVMLVFCVDLVLATQLNTPFTSYMQSSGTKKAQEFLKDISPGFPPPPVDTILYQSQRAGAFKPFEGGMNILLKEMTSDKQCSFAIKSHFEFIQSDCRDEVLRNPWFFAANQDSSRLPHTDVAINLVSFSPNKFGFQTNSGHGFTLVLLQNYYPHWKVSVNELENDIGLYAGTFMSVNLDKGENTVSFEYKPVLVRVCFGISLTCFILLIFAIGYFYTIKSLKTNRSVG